MILPAGIPVNVSACFDGATAANVAMSVYDDSGTSPSLLSGPTLMTPVVGNAYRAKFTPVGGKLYVIFMGVYTSGAFSSLDPAFSAQQQSLAVQAQYTTPPVQDVIGVVDCNGGN